MFVAWGSMDNCVTSEHLLRTVPTAVDALTQTRFFWKFKLGLQFVHIWLNIRWKDAFHGKSNMLSPKEKYQWLDKWLSAGPRLGLAIVATKRKELVQLLATE